MAQGGSIERVRAALLAAGHEDSIVAAPQGARSAAEAAAAVGCEVARIVKSLVFRCGDTAVLVLISGADRAEPARLAAALGGPVERADAAFVRAATGFAIGGVAPVGHLSPPRVLIDRALVALDPLWAAAGSPAHVFRTDGAALVRITGGTVADIAA